MTADQEASLLQQLTEITRVMQERHLVEEEPVPEKKSWEGTHTHLNTAAAVSKTRDSLLCAELSADYFEDPQAYWEESDHCCPHRREEAEAERTQTGEADSEIIPEDVPEVEAPSREGEEDKTPENGVGVTERKERGDWTHLGVPEQQPGVLDQLELSLNVTSMLEEEKVGSFTGLTEDISGVRRRNKRRKVKKVSH